MRISTQIYIGFALIILFSVVGTAVDLKLSGDVNKNTLFLTTSEAIIRNSGTFHKEIIEMQSGFRGYLLSGNESFLEPYYEGIKIIPDLYKEQRNLIKHIPAQLIRLDSIKLIHDRWVNYSKLLIGEKKRTLSKNDASETYNYLIENKLQKQVGKKMNDEISLKFKAFDRYEFKVREQRRHILNKSISDTRFISIMLLGFVVTIGLGGAIYLNKNISKRIRKMVDLAEKISKGEFKNIVDHENDELTKLSESLNVMSATLEKNFTDLEKQNQELDQFAYVVSHDLKAPLRGVNNIFQWIDEDLEHEVSGPLKRYHNMMRGRIHRLEGLISGLLEYARIGREAKKVELVSLHKMLGEIKESLVPDTFKVEFKLNVDKIVTEKIRLEQVFSNLISNAVMYNGNVDGKIIIEGHNFDTFYQFSVTDDGVGIAPEYHEKIFVIFQTLREKNEKESTGIGLAIVKKIIEDRKGLINIVSDTGKGTSFVFTWPKELNN